ncbi:unnamed protein product, partial [Phaeothamnion confervicola]
MVATIEQIAYRWTMWLQRRPRTVIVASVVVAALCAGRQTRIESDPDTIWVPSHSATSRQKAFFDEMFGPFFRINQLIFTAADGANVINRRHLQRAMHVQRLIETGKATAPVVAFFDDGVRGGGDGGDGSGTGDVATVTLADLCFRPIAGQGCLVESPGQYWRDDPVLLDGDPSPPLTAACQTTEPFLAARAPCMDRLGTPVMRNVVFGGLKTDPTVPNPDPCAGSDSSGGAPAAEALVVTFLLNNRRDAAFQAAAAAWERDVFMAVAAAAAARLAADVQAPMRLSYIAQRSVEDALAAQARDNAWVVVASYAAMLIYVALALGRAGRKKSPLNVGDGFGGYGRSTYNGGNSGGTCNGGGGFGGGGGGGNGGNRDGGARDTEGRRFVQTRMGLALAGVAVVAASLGASVGLLSLAGLGTTLIVWEVVPFLLLAIGVDNVFLLVREFDRLETVPRFERHLMPPPPPVPAVSAAVDETTAAGESATDRFPTTARVTGQP